VQRAPTCTDPGAGTNTCIRCGYAEACTYDLAAHSYGAQKTTAQPTCTKSGSAQAVCTVCGHTDKRKIDATGHTWDQEKCNATVTCTVCGYKNSEGVGHKYELDHASKPTSSTIGTRWYVCKNCGKSKMEYYWDKGTISLSKLESDIAKYAKKCGFNVVSSKSPDAKQSAHIYVPFYMVVWDDSLSPVVEAGEYGIDGVCSRVEDPSAHDVYIEVKFHSSSLVEQFIVNVYYL